MTRRLLACLAGCGLIMSHAGVAGELTVFCSSSGTEMALCQSESQSWARETGNVVKLVPLPSDWGTVLPLYRQLLAASDPVVDVLVMDGTWVGSLAPMLGALERKPDDADLMPAPFASAGRRVALPWYRDVGLLFYRRDLLEKYRLPVPQSWDELEREALLVQAAERRTGQSALWGYVWQGRTAESLLCNALEWLGPQGGTLVPGTGQAGIDNPAARSALSRAARWVGTISPEGVLSDDEEAARGAFQTGHAVFMRNWVYAWALANDPQSVVAGKVGVAPLPRERSIELPGGVDGTVYLGIARNTRHPAEAASLIRYLTSRPVERARAAAGAYVPARRSLLDDPDVLAAIPVLTKIRPVFEAPLMRPVAETGQDYPRLAWMVENSFHDVLRGQRSAPDALRALSDTVEAMALRGQWLSGPTAALPPQEKTE
ncbi:extracellular solute-binding protein [Brytella acorum]|uniref:Extracellular solute-binding protein n=1 Tax=Brytella acorum TaxID=2959299 RepID=A0AA35XWW6_9PROT|nr:extracellular solute-binding protein [Brytella acorum]MDF3625670.1 extracellular solute-binding protein [Brytella acorum]CAI9121299.1 extracellular solute-binding protein [Brytella acorum]